MCLCVRCFGDFTLEHIRLFLLVHTTLSLSGCLKKHEHTSKQKCHFPSGHCTAVIPNTLFAHKQASSQNKVDTIQTR